MKRVVTNNVEHKLRKASRKLLDSAELLHKHFYKACLCEQTLKEYEGQGAGVVEENSQINWIFHII
ncbi:MAG: hypothetical protein QXN53_08850 [Thermoproteota archaeon]